jgi:hypothetical protein
MSGDSEEANINNSINWVYRCRSFSLSKNFRSHLIEFIRHVSNSKIQLDLFGDKVKLWDWSFHGLTSKIESKSWIVLLSAAKFSKLVSESANRRA